MDTRSQYSLPSNLRYGTPADNVLLSEIGAETFYETFVEQNTPENMAAYLAESFSPEKQALELNDPASKFLILEMDGQAAGYARVYFGGAPEGVISKRPMELVRIYARKAWVGKGIGAQLMQACLGEAKQAGCDVIWLGVWEMNQRAIAFYQKWGFATVGTHEFRLGDDLQHDFIMARPVSMDIK
jgi:GNAT superfamily N-acetyltransferase